MTKKYSSRKERNKYLRVSGTAKKKAHLKTLKAKAQMHEVLTTLKRVNEHTASLKEKHPALFERLRGSLSDVKSAADTLYEQTGNEEFLVTLGEDVDPVTRAAMLAMRAEHTPADAAVMIGADLADMGASWGAKDAAQIREDMIAGMCAFYGMKREQAEEFIDGSPGLVAEVTQANNAIHEAQEAVTERPNADTALIREYVSPYAATGVHLDALAAIAPRPPIGLGPMEGEEPEDFPDALSNELIAQRWKDGKLHANNVREVIHHTQSKE